MNSRAFLRAVSLLFFSAFLILTTACSSMDEYDTNTAEGSFKLGEKYVEDERYEEAIALFSDVKNKFPYSKLATESELKIADVQYERESYVEAQTAYEVFKELHPKHARSDYVTYRLGMSLVKQLPSTIDRDLTLAERAIVYFQEVVRSYPTSEYVASAKEERLKCREMLAEKEYYIGDFYSVRKMHESALTRYDGLLANYPESKTIPMTLAAASRSALILKDKAKASHYYELLKDRFPKSSEFSNLKSEIGNELSK